MLNLLNPVCLSVWFYFGPGSVTLQMFLAQGDDEQARYTEGSTFIDWPTPQWIGATLNLPYARRSSLYLVFTNITGRMDLDDLSVDECNGTEPLPPMVVFECDFDEKPCLDSFSLSYYTYSWSRVQAAIAQNVTNDAPGTDFSTGQQTGHYLWLNNPDSMLPAGAGYFSTPILNFSPSDSTNYCLNFQYYAFGTPFLDVKLSVFAENQDKAVQHVWPIYPVNYTYWVERWTWGFAPLPTGDFSLVFSVNTESGLGGSFAIDSISVSSCPYYSSFIQPTSHLEFACDFDRSYSPMCDIISTDFIIKTPRDLINQNLGPHVSSGFSGDSFLYWSYSGGSITISEIRIPKIETNRDICVRFSYFVNSSSVSPNENNMEIALLIDQTTQAVVQLDTTGGWKLYTHRLQNVTGTKILSVRVKGQQQLTAAVAFDDVTIAQCAGLNVLTTTTAQPNRTSSISINLFLFFFLIFMK
ncbi:unnamed protein product [Rotaria magnacalcarata]|uniref:MAM domain-containing protein n=2 Tax=Rotaria magnacalcarata TaxID=392030 RepID=A0A816VZA6_9BILA|nr:unnamed protein product [Rotaria magnacalcarata]